MIIWIRSFRILILSLSPLNKIDNKPASDDEMLAKKCQVLHPKKLFFNEALTRSGEIEYIFAVYFFAKPHHGLLSTLYFKCLVTSFLKELLKLCYVQCSSRSFIYATHLKTSLYFLHETNETMLKSCKTSEKKPKNLDHHVTGFWVARKLQYVKRK